MMMRMTDIRLLLTVTMFYDDLSTRRDAYDCFPGNAGSNVGVGSFGRF